MPNGYEYQTSDYNLPSISGGQGGMTNLPDLESIIKMFKPSMLELFAPGIGTGVSALLGGLGGLLKGKSEGEKARESLRKLIQNRMGQKAIDPQQFYGGVMKQLAPRIKRRGEIIEKRLGLDTGVAQGELFGQFFEDVQSKMFDLQQWAAQINAQQEMQRLQMLSQLAMVK